MSEPDYGGVARSVNSWWNITAPQEPTTLTLETLLNAWDKLSGQLREPDMDECLEELLSKAGVADEKREKYLDRVNQYDQAEVDKYKAIVQKNFARVWETRRDDESERDLVDRTLGLIEIEDKAAGAWAWKLLKYGPINPVPGGTKGKLTGLSNC